MQNIRIFLFLFFIILASGSQATTVKGLYEGLVPIVDKSSTAQTNGIRAALLQVLIKLTGKRAARSIYGVDDILKQPERFLQQFEIRESGPEGKTANAYALWARFDANSLQATMNEYNIPIWSQERPSSLIWLVQNNPDGGQFPQMKPGNLYFDIVMTQARARGVELIPPSLDATDRANLSASDIQAKSLPAIQSASGRYPSNAVLTANVSKLGADLWQVDWLSIINQQASSWQTSGSSAAQALSEGIDTHADKLARLYTQQVGYASESNFNIRINGIASFDDYANALKYLESLNFISKVDIKEVTDESILYNLVARGDVSALEQAVSLGFTLKPLGDGQSFQYIR